LVLFLNGLAMAQGQSQAGPGGYVLNPYSGMYGSMGNVYSPYYRQFHMPPGMSGMSGGEPGSGTSGMSQTGSEPDGVSSRIVAFAEKV
jgi:hypothetical protein